MISRTQLTLLTLQPQVQRIVSLLKSTPELANKSIREAISIFFSSVPADLQREVFKILEENSQLSAETFAETLRQSLHCEELMSVSDAEQLHECFSKLMKGEQRKFKHQELQFSIYLRGIFESMTRSKFQDINLIVQSNDRFRQQQSKFSSLIDSSFSLYNSGLESLAEALLVLGSPRNSSVDFKRKTGLFFKNLFYKGYLSALLNNYMSLSEQESVLSAAKGVALLINFMGDQKGEQFQILRNHISSQNFMSRNVSLIVNALNKQVINWNIFILTLLIQSLQHAVRFIVLQKNIASLILQACLSQEGTLFEKTVRIELAWKIAKRADQLQLFSSSSEWRALLNQFCRLCYQRTFVKKVCQSQSLLYMITDTIYSNVLQSQVLLDNVALNNFLQLIHPKSSLQVQKLLFVFLTRSAVNSNLNFNIIKDSRKLLAVIEDSLKASHQLRIPALIFLLKMQESCPEYMTASILRQLLDGQNYLQIYWASQILVKLGQRKSSSVFWQIQQFQLVSKSILVLSKIFNSEDKFLQEVYKTQLRPVHYRLAETLFSFFFMILSFANQQHYPDLLFSEQFSKYQVYSVLQNFIKEGLVTGLARNRTVLLHKGQSGLPFFVVLHRVISLLGTVGKQQLMGDILLLKDLLLFKLVDKSQTIKFNISPRMRVNLYFRSTHDLHYDFHAWLPFELNKFQLQRYLQTNFSMRMIQLFASNTKEITNQQTFAEYKNSCLFSWSPLDLLVYELDSKVKLMSIDERCLHELVERQISYTVS